jgi:hypothetical protein
MPSSSHLRVIKLGDECKLCSFSSLVFVRLVIASCILDSPHYPALKHPMYFPSFRWNTKFHTHTTSNLASFVNTAYKVPMQANSATLCLEDKTDDTVYHTAHELKYFWDILIEEVTQSIGKVVRNDSNTSQEIQNTDVLRIIRSVF